MGQRRNQKGIKKIFGIEWRLKQNKCKLWNATKAMHRGKFTTLNAYNTKKESFQSQCNLSFQLKILEKKIASQIESKQKEGNSKDQSRKKNYLQITKMDSRRNRESEKNRTSKEI